MTLNVMPVIKEKRDSSIKGYTCANESKQRRWKLKKLTLPTACANSVFLISTINTLKERERVIGVADISDAYLNAEIGEFLVLKLSDE